jgi:hypothetical protein
MTEAEWLACDDPRALLQYQGAVGSERKLRLFACACCRRVGRLLNDAASCEALVVAERFADGLVDDAARSAARKAAQRAAQGRGVVVRPTGPKWERRAASAVYYALDRTASSAAWHAPQLAVEALVWEAGGHQAPGVTALQGDERSQQARLLRDIDGYPYRAWQSLASPIAACEDATVLDLALTIYEERAFNDAPALADALEDAGCADDALLGHLRGPGPHVRGCWVIDLLLGKR